MYVSGTHLHSTKLQYRPVGASSSNRHLIVIEHGRGGLHVHRWTDGGQVAALSPQQLDLGKEEWIRCVGVSDDNLLHVCVSPRSNCGIEKIVTYRLNY